MIDATGAPYTVSLSTSVAVNSIAIDDPQAILQLTNGGLRNSAITGLGQMEVKGNSSGSLTNVQLNVPLTVRTLGGPSLNGELRVDDDSRLNSTISLLASSVLRTTGTGTLGGSGFINFDSVDSNMPHVTGQNVVIGAGLTIQTGLGSGRVGIEGTGFTNLGTLSSANGHGISLEGYWKNFGTISTNGGYMSLGGTFSGSGIGTLINNGHVSVYGFIENSGDILDIRDSMKEITLAGGTISGGRIQSDGAGKLVTKWGAVLRGTTVATSISASEGETLVLSGLTLDGGAIVVGGSNISLSGLVLKSGIVGGIGELVMKTGGAIYGETETDSVQFGPGVRVRAEQSTGTLNFGTLVNQGTIGGDQSIYLTGGSLRNEGYLKADTGALLSVNAFDSYGPVFLNQGTIASDGGNISIGGHHGNSGTIHFNGGTVALRSSGGTYSWNNSGLIRGMGGTLIFSGNWNNTGSVDLTNTALYFDGSFTAANLGTILRSGGSVNIRGTLNNASTSFVIQAADTGVQLSGGTIIGGTIDARAGSSFRLGSGVLDGVVLKGTFEKISGGTVTAPSGLTLDHATLSIQASGTTSSSVQISGSLDGTGTITFDGPGTSGMLRKSGGTLAIGSGITIQTGSAGGSLDFNGTVVNEGTLVARTSGRTLYVGPGTFRGLGSWLRATNDSSLLIASAAGTLGGVVADLGGRITLNGTYTLGGGALIDSGALTIAGNWVNPGSIQVSSGTLTIAGYNAALGNIELHRSNLVLETALSIWQFRLLGLDDSDIIIGATGALNNTNDLLQLDGSVGRWKLGGGTIDGGSITGGAASALQVIGNGGTLTGVTNFAAIEGSATTLSLAGNWANHGTINLRNSTLQLFGTPTAIGSINLSDSLLSVRGTFSTAQIESIHRDYSPVMVGGSIVSAGFVDNSGHRLGIGAGSGDWIMRYGTISGGTIASTGGTLVVPSVGSGNLNGVTLEGAVDVQGTLRLQGEWRNDGSITVNGGALSLESEFSPDEIGVVYRNSGSILVAGNVKNAGTTFDLDTHGWGIYLNGAAIDGGTINSSNSNRLNIGTGATSTSFLDGLVLNGPVAIASRGQLRALNGLIINGTITMNDIATLSFQGSQVLDGSGTIVMNSTLAPARPSIRPIGGTVTIGKGITVLTGTASGTLGSVGNGLVNRGTVISQTTGRGLAFLGDFENRGVVVVRSSGTMNFTGATVTNLVAETLTGGRWAVYANSTMTMGASTITTNNANILLDGPNSTFAPINPLHTNLGTFAIDHGRSFVTAGSLSNSGLLGIGTNSTMFVSGQLNNTGSVDLVGTLIVDYAPGEGESSTFETLVNQIGTSILASVLDPAKGIGSADNAELQYTSFGGQSVDPTSVLLMLTYFGDTDLDGQVDLDDFDDFLTGFAPAEAAATWTSGDFDYSGVVNLTDFELYLHGYYALGGSSSAIAGAVQNSPVSEQDKQAMLTLVATVPEPVFSGIVGLSIPWLLRRKRRCRAG